MRILITGAGGNVGRELQRQITALGGHTISALTQADLDITDFEQVRRQIAQQQPEVVIHSAAMTAVDQCAQEPDQALRVNAYGAQNVALGCAEIGAAMLHISTNEVFSGESNRAFLEYDVCNPINAYAYSKWVGEQMVREALTAHYIVRTSWVFAHGGNNFVQKILAAAAAGRPISVVVDEVACPTYADDLVEASIKLIATKRYGTYHFANDGAVSRYDFARYVLDSFGYTDTPITRIVKAQWQRPSKPPTYSALRNFFGAQMGISLRDWKQAVVAFAEKEKASAV
ncbi:MAG: dTDP-4-dehydrorhamnose reductase [Anaerolineae bacterium]